MSDQAILFFLILLIIVSFYRMILSFLFLRKKKMILDEKFYISFFYESTIGIIVLFTDNLVLGLILALCLPIVLILYVGLFKNRTYWIINGYDLSEATFVNDLIAFDSKFSNNDYRLSKIRFFKKKDEKKIKLSLSIDNYLEKEKIMKVINDICKEKGTKINKKEIINLIIYSLLVLFLLLIIMFVLII